MIWERLQWGQSMECQWMWKHSNRTQTSSWWQFTNDTVVFYLWMRWWYSADSLPNDTCIMVCCWHLKWFTMKSGHSLPMTLWPVLDDDAVMIISQLHNAHSFWPPAAMVCKWHSVVIGTVATVWQWCFVANDSCNGLPLTQHWCNSNGTMTMFCQWHRDDCFPM